MKKKKDVEEKVYSIEELAEYIHTSEDMKKDPKKPMSLFTKIIIWSVIIILSLFIYFKFIYKPYVFTVEFKPGIYDIDGFLVITKAGGKIIVGSNEIFIEDNISDVIRYYDYENLERNFALLLSEHGNLYLYDIDNNSAITYYNEELKVKKISLRKLDKIYVDEIVFEDGTYVLAANSKIYARKVEDTRIMDDVIYNFNDIYIYTRNNKLYMSVYDEISHYDILTNAFTESNKLEKAFKGENSEDLSVLDAEVKVIDKKIYVYIISENGEIYIYNFDASKFDELPNEMNISPIKLNVKLESFEKINLEDIVRAKVSGEERFVEVYKDKLVYGSISSDLSLISYLTDFSDANSYIITSSDEGNNKYLNSFFAVENAEENSLQIVFLNNHEELLLVSFNLENLDEISYITKKIKMEENERVDSIFNDEGTPKITIEKTIHTEYVVFESTTEYEKETYSLEEFLKGVEYYE